MNINFNGFPLASDGLELYHAKKMNKLALQVESLKEMKEKDFNEEHFKSSIKRGSKHPQNLIFSFKFGGEGNFFKSFGGEQNDEKEEQVF